MFWHLRGAFLCDGRGFSITLGYFINRTAGAQLPDPLPPPAVCMCEHVENQMADNQCSGKTRSRWEPNETKAAACYFPEETLKSLQLDSGRVCSLFFSQVKKRPFGLTAPFILYYPAWLLTPEELCSQIDALLLWGSSWNIKLHWNIHMWVHLAESNWCATPQTPNGNVAGPLHVLSDTLSPGPDSDCDLAKATKSDLNSNRLPDTGWLMWVSAWRPGTAGCCGANQLAIGNISTL